MPTTIDSAGITFNDATSLTSANIGTAQIVNGSVTASKLGTNEQKQICKAWVNFDGTNAFSPNPSTTAIRSSYNVSSITRNGTGDYTVNFATPMADANYSVNGTGKSENSQPSNFGFGSSISLASGYTPSTSSVRIWAITLQASSTAVNIANPKDQPSISVQIFGN